MKGVLLIPILMLSAIPAAAPKRPDELWIGNRGANNQLLLKDPALMKSAAQAYADLPGGEPHLSIHNSATDSGNYKFLKLMSGHQRRTWLEVS